jgi:uncharacterized protein YjiS (DUF1127 family)
MQHWPMSSPELEYYIARGRRERALALQRFLRGTPAAVALASRVPGKVAAAVGRWRRRRAALTELRSLDDRMLKDIGLVRNDVPYLADRYAETGRPAVRTPAGILPGGTIVPRAPEGAGAVPADPAERLRSPLTAIRSSAEVLRDHPDLPQGQRQAFLRAVIFESERLDREIGRVFDHREAA